MPKTTKRMHTDVPICDGVLSFSSATVPFYWNSEEMPLADLLAATPPQLCLVEEAVHTAHQGLFAAQPLRVLPGGETHKRWQDLQALLELFLAEGVQRRQPLLAVGGGAHLDLVACAAALYHRGVPLIGAPSTLLSMVDAAIGGKNGINFGGYKNMIGTISQPLGLIFDIRFLNSLPDTAWSDGFAEVIKYACIADPTLFAELAATDPGHYRHDKHALRGLILRCVRHKVDMVAEDEQDRHQRRVLLNFGHSVGHGLEATYGCSHGQGVACGMAFGAWLSVQRGLLPSTKYEQLCALLSRYGLPIYIDFDADALLDVLRQDKKRHHDQLQEICMRDFGHPCIVSFSFSYLRRKLLAYRKQQL